MIAWSLEVEIRRLLAEGRWSMRRISKLTGASRGAVAGVARDRGSRKRGAAPSLRWPREETPRRCARCGRMVHHPCLACHLQDLSRGARAAGVESRVPRDLLPASELQRQDTRLNLGPNEQLRYQELRSRLEAQRLIASDSSAAEADWK